MRSESAATDSSPFNSLRNLGVLGVSCGYADLTQTPTNSEWSRLSFQWFVRGPTIAHSKITARDAENAEVARRVEFSAKGVESLLEVQNSTTDAILQNDLVEVYK